MVHPEDIQSISNAYAKVVNNLNHHVRPANQYPTPKSFSTLVTTGPAVYGEEALRKDEALSDGPRTLIDRFEESEEPLWVLSWAGTNFLAQALQHASSATIAK